MRPRRSAFTLIELLTVVAVIALLISILLPAMKAARERGRITKCLGNLHGVLVASQAYMSETPSGTPFTLVRIVDDGGRALMVRSPFVYGGSSAHPGLRAFGSAFQVGASRRPYNRLLTRHSVSDSETFEMFSCPGDRIGYTGDGLYAPEISTYRLVGTSYFMNLHAILDTVPSPDAPLETSERYYEMLVRQANAHFNSQFVLLMESALDTSFLYNIQLLGSHQQFSRHSVGFLDGHATYALVDSRGWCGPGWVAINPRWVSTGEFKPRPFYKLNSGKSCD